MQLPRALALMLGMVLALAGCVGCGDDDSRPVDDGAGGGSVREATTSTERDSESGTTTTAAEPTSTSAPSGSGTVEEEIVARYKAFWEARFAANSPPDPDDPALRKYGTGEALDQIVAEAQANEDAGVEFRPNDDPVGIQRIDVINVEGDRATVQECVVDDGLVVRQSDGSVVNDVVATHNKEGQMRRVDGEWRLASLRVVQRWEGVAGCALAD
jgi:hypothetical protein